MSKRIRNVFEVKDFSKLKKYPEEYFKFKKLPYSKDDTYLLNKLLNKHCKSRPQELVEIILEEVVLTMIQNKKLCLKHFAVIPDWPMIDILKLICLSWIKKKFWINLFFLVLLMIFMKIKN